MTFQYRVSPNDTKGGVKRSTKGNRCSWRSLETEFESDVREGKANVKVVSNHGKPSSGGGGGSIDWLAVLFLMSVATSGRVHDFRRQLA
jgi:hypothetical protein